MPESAARISAGMMLMNEEAIATRMPVTMYGAADGMTTRTKICNWFAPRHSAARWRAIGARQTPAMVLTRTMKNVPQKMRKYLESSPMPNQMTAIGIIAGGERERMSSI